MVFVMAALFGTVTAADNPTRQTFVLDMVGGERVQNAVSLNSVLTKASRPISPAVADGLIAAVGVGVCFLVNAGSFLAVLAALRLMRARGLHPVRPVPEAAHAGGGASVATGRRVRLHAPAPVVWRPQSSHAFGDAPA